MTDQIHHRITSLLIVCVLVSSCATVPFDYPRQHTVAFSNTSETTFARNVDNWTEAHGGLSGFYPLLDGMDAFAARLHMIEKAEMSIDLQYFLMKNDTAGLIISAALLQAADRGVRVRFLLDDVFTTADDELLARLDQHENIEVRLFNPLARGIAPNLNFVVDFKRANRRMHNKSFTADNKITIVGGRNIADEYFKIKTEADFIDFDILAIGQVAADVSNTFDIFWNDARSVPIAAFIEAIDGREYTAWRRQLMQEFQRAGQSVYARAIDSELINNIIDGTIALYPGNYEVITDEPSKLANPIRMEDQILVNELARLGEQAEFEVIVVTPYFIPLDSGVEYWRRQIERGMRILVLTNSLASTNHIAVHSSYSKYRRSIIQTGVELYEARVNAVTEQPGDNTPEILTLHTKAIAIDRESLFVGSLNLDPRSIEINAEMGILINAPEMVNGLVNSFLEDLPEFAYRLEINENNQLNWHGNIDGNKVMETTEPQAGSWRRFKAFLLKIVPDRQL